MKHKTIYNGAQVDEAIRRMMQGSGFGIGANLPLGTVLHLARDEDEIDISGNAWTRLDKFMIAQPPPDVNPYALTKSRDWSPTLFMGRATNDIKEGQQVVGLRQVEVKMDTPIKLPNPDVLPGLNANDGRWAPNGKWAAVTSSGTPFLTIYAWTQGELIKIEPDILPTAFCFNMAWSPDSRYLALQTNISSYPTWIYEFIDDQTPMRAFILSSINSYPNGIGWSPNGRYLAEARNDIPRVILWDWISGSPTRMANPSVLPPDRGVSIIWSPDSRYLTVGHWTAPYMIFYDWVSGVPVKITGLDNVLVLPNIPAKGGWSSDMKRFSITHTGTPFVTNFEWNDGAPIKLSNPTPLPSGTGYDVKWSVNGEMQAVGHYGSPYMTIYGWKTEIPVKVPNPGILPGANQATSVDFHPDDRHLLVTSQGIPYCLVYAFSIQYGEDAIAPITLWEAMRFAGVEEKLRGVGFANVDAFAGETTVVELIFLT